jgi:hypothetical protein
MAETKAKPADELEDHAYLGREFLTWLVWRVDAGDDRFAAKDGEFSAAFGGRTRLGSMAGFATDLVMKGGSPAHGAEARAAIGSGHTVREAELRFARGEREWRFTLLAETLDLRSVKLPALLKEEEDDRLAERLALLEELDELVRAAFRKFLDERTRPGWKRTIVPALREWLVEGLAIE